MEAGINLTMLIVLVIFIMGAIKGWKMGLVQELVSLVSFVALVFVLLLIATGVQSFFDKQYIQIVFIVILLIIVSIATKIGSLIAKLGKSVAKLPLVSFINKLAGVVVGIAEGIVFIWVGMIVMNIFENTEISQFLIWQVNENPFLHYLYDVNVFASYFIQ